MVKIVDVSPRMGLRYTVRVVFEDKAGYTTATKYGDQYIMYIKDGWYSCQELLPGRKLEKICIY